MEADVGLEMAMEGFVVSAVPPVPEEVVDTPVEVPLMAELLLVPGFPPLAEPPPPQPTNRMAVNPNRMGVVRIRKKFRQKTEDNWFISMNGFHDPFPEIS